jgi:IS5 family transposase
MGPKPTVPSSGDLYRSRLDQILDQRQGLFRLAALINWDRFDQELGRFHCPLGRPAKPTRLMVGLSYLQHTFNLSDEAVVQQDELKDDLGRADHRGHAKWCAFWRHAVNRTSLG